MLKSISETLLQHKGLLILKLEDPKGVVSYLENSEGCESPWGFESVIFRCVYSVNGSARQIVVLPVRVRIPLNTKPSEAHVGSSEMKTRISGLIGRLAERHCTSLLN